MSRLDELIKELCPNGVEYKKIEEFIDYIQPNKYIVESTKYDDSFETPVLTAGQSFILGYTNETNRIYYANKENPVIIFDDFTAGFHWVDFKFKVKSSAMKILKSKNNINFRYFYHIMGKLNYTSTEHARLWIGTYSQFEIPVPPRPIQDEIVRILDNFTKLTAELTAELRDRKKQYEHYRDELFSNINCDKCLIKDLASIKRGIRVTKKDLDDNASFAVYQNALKPLGYYSKYNVEEKNTYIISAGAAGEIGFSNSKFWAADDCLYFYDFKMSIINKFIYYYLLAKQTTIKSMVRKASIPRLSKDVVEKMEIPLPPLEEQERIVAILDKFDKYCNDITEGLPAEIEMRQKQYEYYRDKLLTFKRLN